MYIAIDCDAQTLYIYCSNHSGIALTLVKVQPLGKATTAALAAEGPNTSNLKFGKALRMRVLAASARNASDKYAAYLKERTMPSERWAMVRSTTSVISHLSVLSRAPCI